MTKDYVLTWTVIGLSAMATMVMVSCASDQAVSGTDKGHYLGPAVHGPENQDRLTNSVMHSLPLDEVVKEAWTGKDGNFPPSRVTSIISPVVVRRNDPSGPKYQEGLGYTFLVNAPKYPGLCRMDDGTLVLTLTAALVEGSAVGPGSEDKRVDVILYSRDDGMSWTQPRRIPGYRTTPMNLGGNKLMIRGWNSKIDVPEAFRFWFSDDMGQTWSEEETVPPLPDGSVVNTDVAMNFPIEGDTIWFMFYHNPPGGAVASGTKGRAGTIMRPYNFVKHTWSEPTFFPRKFRSSEASLARAINGDLVASFRTGRDGIPSPFDGWRGIVTARSSDDGKTWSEPAVHSLYGHVHHSLLTFPDGRILMTYAARIGELDGRVYRGFEAVLSHDHGKTWDWERRYILFRGPITPPHSPQSVLLSDGRVLTVVFHPITFSWKDQNTSGNIMSLSNVSAVIWSPDI